MPSPYRYNSFEFFCSEEKASAQSIISISSKIKLSDKTFCGLKISLVLKFLI